MLELPLSALKVGAANVRHASEMDDNLATLMASIASVGLLQPLVVAKADDGGFEVVAGRRRFTALTELAANGNVFDTVPCFEVPAEAAGEASLAENYVRQAMTTKELYAAFDRMTQGGKSPDDIAAAFGFEVKRVARILRLANLAPEIMEAWDTGKISDGFAQAYAFTDDHEIQRTVFATGYHHHPDSVRRAIAALVAGEVDDDKARFVGIADYEAAGGKLLRDLFSDNVQFLDAPLLEQLYAEKIERLAAEQLAGVRYEDGSPVEVTRVDQPPRINRYGYEETDWELRVKPVRIQSPEDATRTDEIQERLDALWDEEEAIEQNEDNYVTGGDDDLDELKPEAQAQLDAIAKERDALTAEHAAIEARIEERVPNGTAKIVAYVRPTRDTLETTLYYASREEAGLPTTFSNQSTKVQPASNGGQSVVADPPGIIAKKANGASSRNGFMALQVLFADAVVTALHADAKGSADEAVANLGLDGLLFGLARSCQMTAHVPGAGYPRAHAPERGPFQVAEILGRKKQHLTLGDVLGETPDWLSELNPAAAWDLYRAWINATTRARLGAALLGTHMSAVENNFSERPRPLLPRLLAESLDCASPSEWAEQNRDARDKAVDIITHKKRLEVMRSWGVPEDSLKALKAATSAAFMRSVLDSDDKRKLLGIDKDEGYAAIDAWLPAELEIEPVERPKPKAKAPAKKKKAKAEEKELEPAE